MARRVLITGGAGFIGSHTCLVLLEQGHELVVLDNFDNSSPEALNRVQELAGPRPSSWWKGMCVTPMLSIGLSATVIPSME